MSRRGILIRVLIFGPLFLFFGTKAIWKCQAERQAEADAEAAAAAREAELKAATTKHRLPNGSTIDIVELTPEQAERLHGIKLPEDAPPAKSAVDAKAPEVKALDAVTPEIKAPAPAAPAGEAKAN